MDKFRNLNVPIIHRPMFQKLALHYLASEREKAAFFLSLSMNMAFRQHYTTECIKKMHCSKENDLRWQTTYDMITKSIQNCESMRECLDQVMPARWTVLQFCMVDEIAINGIDSQQVTHGRGVCMGERDRAALFVTKYQRKSVDHATTIETRHLRGFANNVRI